MHRTPVIPYILYIYIRSKISPFRAKQDTSASCWCPVRPVGDYFPDNDRHSIHYPLHICIIYIIICQTQTVIEYQLFLLFSIQSRYVLPDFAQVFSTFLYSILLYTVLHRALTSNGLQSQQLPCLDNFPPMLTKVN